MDIFGFKEELEKYSEILKVAYELAKDGMLVTVLVDGDLADEQMEMFQSILTEMCAKYKIVGVKLEKYRKDTMVGVVKRVLETEFDYVISARPLEAVNGVMEVVLAVDMTVLEAMEEVKSEADMGSIIVEDLSELAQKIQPPIKFKAKIVKYRRG